MVYGFTFKINCLCVGLESNLLIACQEDAQALLEYIYLYNFFCKWSLLGEDGVHILSFC